MEADLANRSQSKQSGSCCCWPTKDIRFASCTTFLSIFIPLSRDFSAVLSVVSVPNRICSAPSITPVSASPLRVHFPQTMWGQFYVALISESLQVISA